MQERTGRRLEIPGDIDLSVFPWLGLKLGKVSLGNPAGLPEGTFASAEAVEVRVKLIPLLQRQVEMDTVTLRGLALDLVRTKDGRSNWADLGGTAAPAPEPAPAPGRPGGQQLAALAVGGLDVQDARLAWRDEAAGTRYAVEGLNLKTGALAAGRPVRVDLDFQVASAAPELRGKVSLGAELDADPAVQTYRAKGLVVDVDLQGKGLPGAQMKARLSTDAELDLDRETLSLPRVRIEALGLQLALALQAEQLRSKPRYSGSLDLAEADLRQVLGRMGGAPSTADPEALRRASAGARFTGGAEQLSVESLTVRLDDTTLQGKLTVASFKGPALRFDLSADALDLDRYLPPPAGPAESAAAASPTAGAARAAALPLESLRALDLDGRLRLARLRVGNLQLADVALKLSGKNGLLRVDPAEARLYQGGYRGHIQVDARGRTPRISIDEQLSGIQAGPLLKDLLGEERLTGTGDVALKLTAEGAEAGALRRSLNGQSRFLFINGAVKGINIGRMIREARARLEGQPPPPEQGPVQTDFSELSATIQIVDGVARNEDLAGKSPLLRVQGRGSADLVKERLDYLLTAVIVATSKGQGGKELQTLAGIPIPIRVSGPFASPDYALDLSEVLKQQATRKVEQKLEEKLQKQLGDSPAGGALKGLLGR
jgi:AsmA protein